MNEELHVVLGASGGTGSALVEELAPARPPRPGREPER